MGKAKRRQLTPTEITEWLVGEAEKVEHHVLVAVNKYDDARITTLDLQVAIKNELAKMAYRVYDQGFEDGVHGSTDVLDEDDPVAFEIEEDDDEDNEPTRH